MNVLYIAYSCDPYSGSEDAIGWNIPIESAKTNHVWVITKKEHQKSIEGYLKKQAIQNIEFFFVDIPAIYKKVFKGFTYSGRLNVWHRYAFPLAQEICAKNNIDVIHQITPVEFRSIGKYGKIKTAKFVCGPIAGAEQIPHGLRSYASGNMVKELVHSMTNLIRKVHLGITHGLECDYLLFANLETQKYLKKLYHCKNGLLPEIGTTLPTVDISCKKKGIVFLVAGRLVYRKGHAFLLDALNRVPADLDYEVRIVGDGPELEKIKIKTNLLHLNNHVHFIGKVPYKTMDKEYACADVLIMPSLREATGTVVLEAISRGIPVITINSFGGSLILNDECAWLYSGTNKQAYIDNLANSMMNCIMNPDEVLCKGINARRRSENYTWKKKCVYYQEIYRQCIG